MAQISFKAGSYAQYASLGTYDPSTLYFISEGAIYKGNVNCTDQVIIVETLPQTLVDGKIYIEKDSGKVTYYDGTTSTVVNAATVFKTLQTTYCNLLMRQVEAMTNAEEVRAVKYGVTELTGEFAERYEMIKASLMGENSETNS